MKMRYLALYDMNRATDAHARRVPRAGPEGDGGVLMRALVVYCHPKETSFTAAVRDVVLDRLRAAGAEVRLRDLYAEGFDPRLTAHDLDIYEDEAVNGAAFAGEIADLRWCDTLIFVYPTWWYGLPAMLKGWLDRVLVPGVAFLMPEPGGTIRPGLHAHHPAGRLHHLRGELVADHARRRAGAADDRARDRASLREGPQARLRGALPHGQFDRRLAPGASGEGRGKMDRFTGGPRKAEEALA
jgi:putative NADPH-quinone reductase